MEHLGTILIISFIFGVAFQLAFDVISLFITSQGRDMTLSRRTLLWNDLLKFPTNPLIGVGYGSFWLGDRLTLIWEKYVWMPNESHNGYLNVYLELGFVGLGLLLGVIGSGFRKIKKDMASNFDYGRFCMGIFFITLIYNVTEDAIGKSTLLWFIFLLVSLDVPRQIPLNTDPLHRK